MFAELGFDLTTRVATDWSTGDLLGMVWKRTHNKWISFVQVTGVRYCCCFFVFFKITHEAFWNETGQIHGGRHFGYISNETGKKWIENYCRLFNLFLKSIFWVGRKWDEKHGLKIFVVILIMFLFLNRYLRSLKCCVMCELTFVRKVKNKWNSVRNVFSRSSKKRPQ